jgi:hypothetical protein
MTQIQAIAEDVRRLGLTLLITGLVVGFLQDKIGGWYSAGAVGLGFISVNVGYWLHDKEDRS